MDRRSFIKWCSLSPLAAFLPKIKAKPDELSHFLPLPQGGVSRRKSMAHLFLSKAKPDFSHGELSPVLKNRKPYGRAEDFDLEGWAADAGLYGTAVTYIHPDGRHEHIPLCSKKARGILKQFSAAGR